MMTNSFRKSAATLVVLSLAALAAAGAVAQSPAPPDAKPAAAQGTPAAPESKSAAPETAPAEKKPAPAKSRRAPSGPKTPAQAPEDSPLAPLAWLEGCWRGMVNQRETREHWMPLRGNMMLGMSQTVVAGKTQDFEYLRLESRPDGIYYLAFPAGQNETPFKFAGQIVMTIGDRNDDGFPFVNPTLEFPQKLIYRRASEGWLYISLIGKVKGADKEVVYPMRRVDCESGEALPR